MITHKTFDFHLFKFRAEDGTQTRDPQLGRLMLYQLSYFRMVALRQLFIPQWGGQ